MLIHFADTCTSTYFLVLTGYREITWYEIIFGHTMGGEGRPQTASYTEPHLLPVVTHAYSI